MGCVYDDHFLAYKAAEVVPGFNSDIFYIRVICPGAQVFVESFNRLASRDGL